jgi:hypothetical protein
MPCSNQYAGDKMAVEDVWQPLHEELMRQQEAGGKVYLWLRDDDAVAPVAALKQLIDLTGILSIPVALAVIPAISGEALVRYLQNANHATPVVHGWNHENHALAAQKKQELGDHRNLDIVLGDLSNAIRRMTQLFGDTLVPMLVPPWNRIGDIILPHLHHIGYRALSCYGVARQSASVPVFNTHVDVIDWHTSRGGRNHAALIEELAMHIRRAGPTGEPIGILTHHMVHDITVWTFLKELFKLTKNHDCCHWLSAHDLISGGNAVGWSQLDK